MVDTVDPIALHMHYRTITSHTPLEITDLSQLAYDML